MASRITRESSDATPPYSTGEYDAKRERNVNKRPALSNGVLVSGRCAPLENGYAEENKERHPPQAR